MRWGWRVRRHRNSGQWRRCRSCDEPVQVGCGDCMRLGQPRVAVLAHAAKRLGSADGGRTKDVRAKRMVDSETVKATNPV